MTQFGCVSVSHSDRRIRFTILYLASDSAVWSIEVSFRHFSEAKRGDDRYSRQRPVEAFLFNELISFKSDRVLSIVNVAVQRRKASKPSLCQIVSDPLGLPITPLVRCKQQQKMDSHR